MIVQICLFESEEEIEETLNEEIRVEKKSDRRSYASETLVYLYKAEDKKENLLYFGITDNFDKRIGDHKSGKHFNKDFKSAYKDHPNEFEFSIVHSFVDHEYCSKGNISKSHAIESFAIAFYNTLGKGGYNRKYMFHHDFRDTEFWIKILPPAFLPTYLNANHEKLNGNVATYVKKPLKVTTKKSGRTQDIVAKKVIQHRLLELKDLDIKLGKYGKELAGINRSNLHKFINGDLKVLGVKRLLEFINAIEEFLGLKDCFDFKTAYLQALSINK